MLTDAQTLVSIKQWQSKLTGLPEQAFEGQAFEEQLDRMRQWHVSRIVAEQMAMLTTAQIMLEHDLSSRDIGTYVASGERRQGHLGTWSFLTGLAGIPTAVDHCYMPLLRSGGYRPFLRQSVCAEIVKLVTDPKFAKAELSLGDVADAIYHLGLSARTARDTLKLVRELAKTSEDAAVNLIQDLVHVRELAEDIVVGLPEIEQQVASASPKPSTTSDAPPADPPES